MRAKQKGNNMFNIFKSNKNKYLEDRLENFKETESYIINSNYNNVVRRFISLFSTDTKKVRQFCAKNNEYSTIKLHDQDRYSYEILISRHLNGEGKMLCVTNEYINNYSDWAVADIVKHSFTIREISKRISNHNLPLIPCLSKSGRIHIYYFAGVEINKDLLSQIFKGYLKKIGLIEENKQLCDIIEVRYPKKIILPYFNYKETSTCAVIYGKKVSLKFFLAWAQMLQKHELEKLIYNLNTRKYRLARFHEKSYLLERLHEKSIYKIT
jgi:hypothetical protein